MPSFITVSIASRVPMPSCRAKIASLIIGQRMRLEMKPGESFASTGSFPITRPTSKTASLVLSEVARPRTTSSNVINGTGLKKCIPITLSGWSVTAPILVIEIEDVFEARMVSLGVKRLSSVNNSSLSS